VQLCRARQVTNEGGKIYKTPAFSAVNDLWLFLAKRIA